MGEVHFERESDRQAAYLEMHDGSFVYGIEWGDPEKDLPCVLKEWINPRIGHDVTMVEIGSGGGRWTRFFHPCKRVYAVDATPKSEEFIRQVFAESRTNFLETRVAELEGIDPHENIDSLEEALEGVESILSEGLRRRKCDNIRFIVSPEGSLAEIDSSTVDYIFSYDTFVHFDIDLFENYLREFSRILKPGGVLHLHYAQRLTENQSEDFRYCDPVELFALLKSLGFQSPTRRWFMPEGFGSVLVELVMGS